MIYFDSNENAQTERENQNDQREKDKNNILTGRKELEKEQESVRVLVSIFDIAFTTRQTLKIISRNLGLDERCQHLCNPAFISAGKV